MKKPIYETIPASDGAKIRTARFEPDALPARPGRLQSNRAGPPVGVLQIIHGFGEAIEHFTDVDNFFRENGYACVIHDQRGHGLMPELDERQRRLARGVTPGYKYLLDDVGTVRAKIGEWYPNLPVYLHGYSMGGNIAINYLLQNPLAEYSKVIIESPWFRLYKPLTGLTAAVARILGRLSAKMAISAGLNTDHISRSRDRAEKLKNDGIYHNRISFRLLSEVTRAGEYAIANAANIAHPVLLLCAGEDKIVCPKAIREFKANAKENVILAEYPDSYHCLHIEPTGAEVLGKMLEFVRPPG